MPRHSRALVWLCLLAAPARAEVRTVPGDYPTIQAAIDAAGPGDEILIAAGTYAVAAPHILPPGGISPRGEGEVVLTGSTDAYFEVVQVQNLDRFRFENLRFASNPVAIRTPVPSHPFHETRLEVEGCRFDANGIGISARNAGQFRLTNSRFEGGSTSVYLLHAWMQAADCVFLGPTRAIQTEDGLTERLVERCLFVDCASYYGAVSVDKDEYFVLANCTFDRCGTANGAAISSRRGGTVVLEHCIVVNGPGLAFGCIGGLGNLFIVSCSDLWNNAGGNWHACAYGGPEQNGNFSADPRFCDAAAGDYTLSAASPCAPANNPCGELIGAYPASCAATAAAATSFSAVKSLY
ncbi:hypothetical protein FJ251_06020 [bacterium]|nr:hypothetical protein [bacterium]